MLNKKFLALISLALINVVGIALPYPIIAPLVLKGQLPTLFNLTPLMTVMIAISLYPLGQFVGSPIIGAYSDRAGTRNVVALSMGLTALGYLLSAFTIYHKAMLLFCISRFITGLVEGNFGVLRAETARLFSSSKERVRAFGLLGSAAGLGWILGPVLGSSFSNPQLCRLFSSHTPFILGSLLALSGVFLSFLCLSKLKREPRGSGLSIREFLSKVYTIERLPLALFLSFMVTLALDGFYQFYPSFLATFFDGNSEKIAFQTTILATTIIVAQTLIVPRVKAQKFSSFLIPSLLMALGIIIFAKGLIELGFVFCGLGIGVIMTLVPAFVSELTPKELQGSVMGSMASLRSLGDFLVCVSFGAIASINLHLPLGLIVVTIVISSCLYGSLARKGKQKVEKTNCLA